MLIFDRFLENWKNISWKWMCTNVENSCILCIIAPSNPQWHSFMSALNFSPRKSINRTSCYKGRKKLAKTCKLEFRSWSRTFWVQTKAVWFKSYYSNFVKKTLFVWWFLRFLCFCIFCVFAFCVITFEPIQILTH